MPYIKGKDRIKFEAVLEAMPHIKTAGELNYLLTMIAHLYIAQNKESYQAYNDIMGALEGCKLELYRREIASYEEIKIIHNGDV